MRIFSLAAFVAAILPVYLLAAEPSAFGAGKLDAPNPYGLTSDEKVILENKKILTNVEKKTKNQAQEVDSLRSRLDGLQTIVEGLSEKTHKTKLELKKLEENHSVKFDSSEKYDKRLTKVTQSNSDIVKQNLENIEKLKVLVTELTDVINTINVNYVTKDEYNLLVKDVNTFKDFVTKELKRNSKPKVLNLSKLSNAEVAKKARKFYDKKLYTKSIEYYSYLIEKKYKPARAHYMIGEMNYYRKNYANAIAYFKKSASLYSKASYMPVLMLHTAVSMKKTGDKTNAKKFLKGIIAKYPNTKYSKDSKKILKSIK